MTDWIAEMPVVFVHPDGRRAPGSIAIGAPITEGEHSSCDYQLAGLDPVTDDPPKHIHGEDNLQALLLTVRFVGMRLQHFRKRGGRVCYAESDDEGDTDVPLEAIFGALMSDRE